MYNKKLLLSSRTPRFCPGQTNVEILNDLNVKIMHENKCKALLAFFGWNTTVPVWNYLLYKVCSNNAKINIAITWKRIRVLKQN